MRSRSVKPAVLLNFSRMNFATFNNGAYGQNQQSRMAKRRLLEWPSQNVGFPMAIPTRSYGMIVVR